MKHYTNQALSRLGLSLSRSLPGHLRQVIHSHRIDHVIDVGANTGQFARMVRKQGYKGALTCFEPNPDAASCITAAVHADVRQVALADQAGQRATLNIYSKTDFSSLNKLSSQFADRYGVDSNSADRLELITSTLDEQKLQGDRCLLKVDTQGFELPILKGSTDLLFRCKVLLLEIAFLPLYEKAPLAGDMLPFLSSLGFELSRLFPVTFVGECIADADCFFLRLPQCDQ